MAAFFPNLLHLNHSLKHLSNDKAVNLKTLPCQYFFTQSQIWKHFSMSLGPCRKWNYNLWWPHVAWLIDLGKHVYRFVFWRWIVINLICVTYICYNFLFLSLHTVRTVRLRQNGWYFADSILKCIFLNDIVWISNKMDWCIGSGNDLTLNRHQTTTWTNDDPVQWHIVQGLHPANKRRRYKVTPSLIGWAQT